MERMLHIGVYKNGVTQNNEQSPFQTTFPQYLHDILSIHISHSTT